MHPRHRIRMFVLATLACFAHTALAIDSFSYTGVLVMPRSEANANLLANGKVLIAGGRSNDGITTSAELYDPSTGLFAATGDMVTMLAYRSSALLPGGKVLFAGGLVANDGNYIGTNTAEVYDSASSTFAATASFAPVGNYQGYRWAATATALADGKVLVAGGTSQHAALSSAQLYDPVTATFAPTGNMIAQRVGHTATLLPSGKVLLAGGTPGSSSPVNDSGAEIYNPGTGTFAITAGAMTSYLNGRYGATATLLADGKVFVAGGANSNSPCPDGGIASAELYNPAAGTFAPTLGQSVFVKYDHTATLLSTGKVLLAGGFGDAFDCLGAGAGNVAELYDPVAGSFSQTGNMVASRGGQTATLLMNGKVLIAGGADPNNTDNSIASAELYDPATGLFSAAASMTLARQDATATALPGGRALIAGGDDFDGGPLNTAELFVANVIFRGVFEGP